jgi:hypothetical protein
VKTELQKMLAGELYEPQDSELTRLRERARELCWALNASKESEPALRRDLLEQLLGSGGNAAWIGAGSVVTRDVPSCVVAAGNPCRVLREISDDE